MPVCMGNSRHFTVQPLALAGNRVPAAPVRRAVSVRRKPPAGAAPQHPAPALPTILPGGRRPPSRALPAPPVPSGSGAARAGVRDAVVDALDELHLAGRPPQEAALSLIGLTYGASLGAPRPAPPPLSSALRGAGNAARAEPGCAEPALWGSGSCRPVRPRGARDHQACMRRVILWKHFSGGRGHERAGGGRGAAAAAPARAAAAAAAHPGRCPTPNLAPTHPGQCQPPCTQAACAQVACARAAATLVHCMTGYGGAGYVVGQDAHALPRALAAPAADRKPPLPQAGHQAGPHVPPRLAAGRCPSRGSTTLDGGLLAHLLRQCGGEPGRVRPITGPHGEPRGAPSCRRCGGPPTARTARCSPCRQPEASARLAPLLRRTLAMTARTRPTGPPAPALAPTQTLQAPTRAAKARSASCAAR